jgi:hypothetical protein
LSELKAAGHTDMIKEDRLGIDAYFLQLIKVDFF